MTQVFKIPESLASKYHGSGYAICSVTGGEIINLIYIRDIIVDFDGDKDSLAEIIDDDRIGPSVRLLQSTGEVYFGMCSCWEFVEL